MHFMYCQQYAVLSHHLHLQCAGRVAAQGAPMDLKAIHGAGYRLTLTLCSPRKTEGHIEALEALIQVQWQRLFYCLQQTSRACIVFTLLLLSTLKMPASCDDVMPCPHAPNQISLTRPL